MEFRRSLRSRSSASRTTVNSSTSSSAKSVKMANESTLSKFSWTSDKSDITITSNGTETPKSHTSPTGKAEMSQPQLSNAILDAEEYKEIVSKLKRASSKEILDYYNKFGSMWFNEFPKTDYVYSPTSENYGKEVAPGIPMKPNMSRSPIRSQNYESLPRSRLDTTDKSYEPSARTLFPLDADSRVNLVNELKEKSSFFRHPSYNNSHSHSSRKSNKRWFHFFFSIFTIVYSFTLGRVFSDSSGSGITYRTPHVPSHQSYPYNDQVAGRKWYFGFTRFLYRSLFLFQRLDVAIISAARSTVQQVFNPIVTNFGHHLKPLAVIALCLPLILLSVLYWWPELYTSFGSYFEEIFIESPTQIFSKLVTSIHNLLSSWFSDFSLFLLLRPFISIYDLLATAAFGATNLLVSTISYLAYLIQTGIFTAFSFATTPFVLFYLKLSEGVASMFQNQKLPYEYQSSMHMRTPDIDYKILAENLLKSNEMRRTFNEWLSEQSLLLEMNHKQSNLDSVIVMEKFKEFLMAELKDREQNVRQSIEQKNAVLKEELKVLEKELKGQEDAQTVAQTAIYDDLLKKISNIENQLKWQTLRLRRCCMNRGPIVSARMVEKHVITYLSKLLSSSEQPLSQNDIRSHLDAIYVARDKLENKLSNLTFHLDHRIREASEASMDVIMAAVTERMGDELSKRVHDIVSISDLPGTFHSGSVNGDSLQRYINRTVEHVLSLYDADKTGMADYALESSGGTILNIKCTESSSSSPAVFYFYGIPVWWTSNNPRKAIQPGMQPGECWSFVGSTGYLVIQLSATIKIHTFSLEHIPKSLSRYGSIDSAPKDFSVWGLKDEKDKGPYFLGKFRYEENGTSLQYFSAQPHDRPFNIVELRIESNWGNLEYTCLYRFRVHGVPV